MLWSFIRLGETLDAHSGYEFSWSPYRLLPFSTSASYHDYHHSHNIGNYSSVFLLWDSVFKTNKHYFYYLQKKKAKEDKFMCDLNSQLVA